MKTKIFALLLSLILLPCGMRAQSDETTDKSDTELNLTVTGNTGINKGAFQYGNIITVTFTPQPTQSASTNALSLEENTATLTYTPTEGEPVQLAKATEEKGGTFTLTYDTKDKKLPIGENLSLTVSYGGSGELNPAEETVTLTLEQAYLKNIPTVTGSFVYGETLTVHYTKQDDEDVSYQWYRVGDDGEWETITGVTGPEYNLTLEDIGNHICVSVIAADEWHFGTKQSTGEDMVSKATLDEIEITPSEATIELGSEGATLTAVITGIKDANDAKNWTWNSSDESIVKVEKLDVEEKTPRSTDNAIESKARVTPISAGKATITVTYESATYNKIEKKYEITVTAPKDPEPSIPPLPDMPKYYNIMVEECEGAMVETSTNVVREGNSVTLTIETAERYDAENMVVKFKRSLFGYWETATPDADGTYQIRNIYADIYIMVEGVTEETPTGIEQIEGAQVYTRDGSLFIQTPQPEQVLVISASGAILKNERFAGLRQFDNLSRGVYIICIGNERFKVRI